MIRKHKKFSRPKKPFDTPRIKAENILVEKYGLKNKREIWKSKRKLDTIRRRAKLLINKGQDEQELFLNKLKKLGYKVENTVDVLSLTEEDVLSRRLQTIVSSKNLGTTAKGSRQLITHKHITIDGKVVNIPSYHVEVSEESKIKKNLSISVKPRKEVKKEVVEEIKEDVQEPAKEEKVEEKPMGVSA